VHRQPWLRQPPGLRLRFSVRQGGSELRVGRGPSAEIFEVDPEFNGDLGAAESGRAREADDTFDKAWIVSTWNVLHPAGAFDFRGAGSVAIPSTPKVTSQTWMNRKSEIGGPRESCGPDVTGASDDAKYPP
jgi:hypothetical protein